MQLLFISAVAATVYNADVYQRETSAVPEPSVVVTSTTKEVVDYKTVAPIATPTTPTYSVKDAYPVKDETPKVDYKPVVEYKPKDDYKPKVDYKPAAPKKTDCETPAPAPIPTPTEIPGYYHQDAPVDVIPTGYGEAPVATETAGYEVASSATSMSVAGLLALVLAL